MNITMISQQSKFIITIICLIIISLSCSEGATDEGTQSLDSTQASANEEQYDNFRLDTVSITSAVLTKLDDIAKTAQRELMVQCPKLTITSGKGNDEIKRSYYIVEGDIKLDRNELYLYCLQRLQNVDTNISERKKTQELTLATDLSGNAAVWQRGTILRYSIMRNSFSSKVAYDLVVKNLKDATNDWMRTCNIKFEYVPQFDNTDVDLEFDTSTKLTFIVREINANGSFIAQSFFPNDFPYKHMLLIDPSYFSTTANRVGVFRHELGHILGFRHEQIWSTDNSCRGESVIQGLLDAVPLTQYDPYSVMHYPCNINHFSTELNITEFDTEGARKIYGLP